MPTEKDLFSEEQTMVAMSFGDHIEELRVRLILGLLGLMVGVVITFIPPLDLGKRVMTKMEEPAKVALEGVLRRAAPSVRADEAKKARQLTPTVEAIDPRRELRRRAPQARPRARTARRPRRSRASPSRSRSGYDESGMIQVGRRVDRARRRPDLARPAGDDDDLLHGLPRRRAW